jgi:hypothetical protein
MSKFKKHDYVGLLGFTPIARASDSEIFNLLVTPMVKGLLGKITSASEPRILETEKGMFPGDEVTNLNDHRLFGTTGYVRFPYISTLYRTEYGALVIKRDATKVKVFGWYGDIDRGKKELIYKTALRDRRFDGTKRGNDCSLLDFPMDDPLLNAPLPGVTATEMSTYGFMPGSRLASATGEQELEDFVANPFTFLNRPELFLHYFNRVWKSDRAPGQVSAPIKDLSKLIIPALEKVSARHGYAFTENAPSHYHVAMWVLSLGYRFTYQKDADALAALTAGIKRIKQSGIALTRPQESWVCVLQSLRPIELIPEGFYMGGPVWPQNNIDNQILWMNKPLTSEAAKLLPSPLPAFSDPLKIHTAI